MQKLFNCQDERGAIGNKAKKLTFKTFKNGEFWQQNIAPDKKSFITQLKHIIF